MDPAALVRSLLDPDAAPYVEPPGRYQQLFLVVLSLGSIPPAWGDVILSASDPLPAFTQLAQMWHFGRVAGRRRVGLVEATTDDIEYNGPGDDRGTFPPPPRSRG